MIQLRVLHPEFAAEVEGLDLRVAPDAATIEAVEDAIARYPVLVLHGQRWLLSHGDILCLEDIEYLKFRALVRTPEWQAAFLARPLEERRALARTRGSSRTSTTSASVLTTTISDLREQLAI